MNWKRFCGVLVIGFLAKYGTEAAIVALVCVSLMLFLVRVLWHYYGFYDAGKDLTWKEWFEAAGDDGY